MRRGRVLGAYALVAVGAALVVPVQVMAGEYTVSVCLSTAARFGTEAPNDFATSGMRVVSQCGEPQGLVTGNDVRSGTVRRGARADVVLQAPPDTRFSALDWTGEARRVDCRYALQIWAEAPGTERVPILNVRANEGCPARGRVQAAQISGRQVALRGATRVVQRVTCMGGGGRRSCSARSANFVRTVRTQLRVEDAQLPSIEISPETPLARGEWVRGSTQRLTYKATENVGIAWAGAVIAGALRGIEERSCALAAAGDRVFTQLRPCPQGAGAITVDTTGVPDGTQTLEVHAGDPAGNRSASTPVTVRVDNTPPARVETRVVGDQGWRSKRDGELAWTNLDEVDRAPIAAVTYRLCPVPSGACHTEDVLGADLSSVSFVLPSPGQWTISLWRRDIAGNQTEVAASVPVMVGYDPDPPQVALERTSATDPTLVIAKASDEVSGVAGGTIEISSVGAGAWRPLPVERQGDRFLARIDDSTLAPGQYQIRARVFDHARNEVSTDAWGEGQPMRITAPLRVVAKMETAFERLRTIRRAVRHKGRTREVARRITVQTQRASVPIGAPAHIVGRLSGPDGNGIPGAVVQVFATPAIGVEQLSGVVQTDAEGRYRYTVIGTSNRALRFVYAGSAVVLPSESRLSLTVPASTALRVDRRRLRNGQAVTFSGPLETLPTPAGGKLIELQVRLPRRWETFRTIRSSEAGQWVVRYRFRRTRGVQYYRFRARLPAEAGYPFVAGVSPVVTVRVSGG